MTHVTCRLTAKNRDRLRNPTLGSRVLATFTFLASLCELGIAHNTYGSGRVENGLWNGAARAVECKNVALGP